MSHYKPNNGPAHPINYLSGIQGLRAVAVILVVFYHSGLNAFSFGYIGVDIFFVISGYLITGTLVKKFEGSQGFRFWHFVSRRIRWCVHLT